MWRKLSSVHEQKTASNKLLLSTKLYEYKMAANDSVVQHIAKVRNMAAQLIDVGEIVSDMAIIVKILGSLLPKFSYFQTAWDNVPQEMQTLSNLEERLLREEARMSASDESPGAFAAVKKSKNKDKTKRKKRKRICEK